MKKWLRRITFGLVPLIVIMSVVTRPRTSQLSGAALLLGARVNPAVLATIERSCRDCHSEATQYPWYSYIAPVSWLIRNDVAEGREHLNFSRWDEYSVQRRERCLSEIANQVRDGGMPLGLYTLMHRDARLSETEVEQIFQWTQVERARLINENQLGK